MPTKPTQRKTAAKVSARDRARSAKAALDAKRAEREKKVEDAATSWYEARDHRDDALALIAVQEKAMAESIVTLIEEGETVDRIAELCDTTATEVRRLRKLVSTDTDEVSEASDTAMPADAGSSAEEAGDPASPHASAGDTAGSATAA